MIEIKGFWWFPDQPDNRFSGFLTYDGKRGGQLTLTSEVTEKNWKMYKEFKDHDAIYGVTSEAKPITILNCNVTSITHTPSYILPNGVATRVILFTYFIEGFHLPSIKTKKIRCLELNLNHINIWFSNFGVNIKWKKQFQSLDIHYKCPKSKRIVIDKNVSIMFNFFQSFSYPSKFSKNMDITQNTYIKIRSNRYESIEFFMKYVHAIRDFFSIIYRKLIVPIEIIIESGIKIKNDDGHNFVVGNFYSPSFFGNEDNLPPHPASVFFLYPDVSEQIDDILRRWLNIDEKIRTIRNLYMSSLYSSGYHLETEFISLSHAVESYHRIFKNNGYVDKKVFRKEILPKLTASIPDNLDSDFKDSIKSRLNYSYEYSLRTRLNLLFEEYGEILNFYVREAEISIGDIVNLRNLFTHYDYPINNLIEDSKKIYECSKILRLLLEICFLSEMGFTTDQVSKFISNTIN